MFSVKTTRMNNNVVNQIITNNKKTKSNQSFE